MTDVSTGWTVNHTVANKAVIHVVAAIDAASKKFPFPILGIDSDNGAEFTKAYLLANSEKLDCCCVNSGLPAPGR